MNKKSKSIVVNKSLKSNFIYYSLRTIMQLFFPLITFPYVSRILLSSGIGKINFCSSIIAYFVLFASLGITTYGIREGAKIRDDKQKLSNFCQEILIINSVTTILSYFVLFLFILFLPQFSNYKDLLIILSLEIGFTTIGVEWLYGALEEYKYISIRSFIINIISLTLVFSFVKTPDDYIKYALIQVFSNVGANLINFIKIRNFIEFKKNGKYNFKRHLKPILLIFGLNIACNIYMNFDKTFLGILSGDESVGFYTVALKINRIVLSLITALGSVMLPRLSYYYENKRIDEFNDLIKKAFNFIFMISIPAFVGLFLLSSPIIKLIGGVGYVPSNLTMKILTLIIPIISISNFIAVQIFLPLGKEKYTLISSSVAAVVNFVLNLLLIPKFAQNGAAIGTVVAELVALIICLLLSRKIINIKDISKYIYQYLIGTIIIIVLYFVLKLIIISEYILLSIYVIISIIVYFIFLLCCKNEYVYEVFQQFKNKVISLKEKNV